MFLKILFAYGFRICSAEGPKWVGLPPFFNLHVMATRHGLDGTGFEPDGSEIFWTHHYRSRGPPSFLHKGYQSLSQGYSDRGVAMITHPFLAPVSSMVGPIRLPPLSACLA